MTVNDPGVCSHSLVTMQVNLLISFGHEGNSGSPERQFREWLAFRSFDDRNQQQAARLRLASTSDDWLLDSPPFRGGTCWTSSTQPV